jgi:hypothetical protein
MKTACEPFLRHKDYYSVDATKVDAYVKEVGELPEGIKEADREDQLTISVRETPLMLDE